MHARSTTFVARPESVDAGIAMFRDDVMPALRDLAGCIGMSLLVDRESGRCIATTAWADKAAMQASADQVRPMRARAAKAFNAATSVDEWQIAAVHREHRSADGAWVRATWLKVRPDQFDRAVDFYKSTVLPEIEALDGFASSSLMSDRVSGRAVVSTTYDSREAMERSQDTARSLRTALLRDLGADQLDVGEFELAIAQLRVPELA
ncbi:antibiotic biosynthesis monooxygenase [Mycobacterium sp. shizuoka-1]|uniref:antibiotic biosynthesis monooxygenase n=1 Tax=Mycobacterium sp. shizuoka-1 TaxID=2039281 RepID=UPI000C07D62E|nr:antibiotic biosynthesis monooxygenase [Mycobacterium sp. shizuoka-1]